MGSLGMLMGRSMAVLRGRADGQRVNEILKEKLQEMLKPKQHMASSTGSKT
jgi:glutamyl-tRNA(Gln) amidotransferase subunit E